VNGYFNFYLSERLNVIDNGLGSQGSPQLAADKSSFLSGETANCCLHCEVDYTLFSRINATPCLLPHMAPRYFS
ncbi:MAG: hypothetical protein Q7I93_01625, partial [Syntrophales bacterium]|nr:hypothetical protein [Syntrophales bacterium]